MKKLDAQTVTTVVDLSLTKRSKEGIGMIILQGTNEEVVVNLCDEDAGCWDCDNCGGVYTH